ncbi:cysteine peptidase C11 family protein [Mucilaginibacter oryzae]|uniref:Cysteine peptidase C11 family protein n=1 Tax=Mucilaginibacter oryzae TaxID=468058 RepID=A0A316HPM2_9SPHI|nr:clostripain-related cysteine peptidase [Mucilaginibacter oryzae]PWK80175.1 cysteine peptidase C11 family protein [Mucilaginibacter oryzae]
MNNLSPKKWNIIFLVYAKLELDTGDLDETITKNNSNFLPPQGIPPSLPIEQEVTFLFNDIIDAGEPQDAHVFVIYNRVDIEHRSDRTALYQLQTQNETGLVLQRIYQTANSNITKPEIIISLFRDTDKINPAKHRVLFTWDHGSIFGIAQGDNLPADFTAVKEQYQVRTKEINGKEWVVTLKGNQAYNRYWDKTNQKRNPFIADACKSMQRLPSTSLIHEILTNEELAQAIAEGFDNHQVDVLVMMNCCMMNVNTIYALYNKSAARYMIAPQSEINFPSYNYLQILKEIYNHPEIDPFLLSKYVIKTLSQKRSFPRDYNFIYNTKFWAILCIDIQQFTKVIYLIKEVIKELTIQIQTSDISGIVNKLNACYRFDSYRVGLSDYMIDLNTFLFLCRDLSTEIYRIHSELEHHLNQLIVDSFIGPSLFPIDNPTNDFRENLKPSGICIFFPRSKEYLEADIFQSFIAENSLSRSAFFSDIPWLNLVCKFISLVNGAVT